MNKYVTEEVMFGLTLQDTYRDTPYRLFKY